MVDAEVATGRLARLRLISTANVGPATLFQLIARFGTAAAALRALPDLARRGGSKVPRIPSVREIEAEMAEVERLGARYLFAGKGLYPSFLTQLDNAPPVLIVRGKFGLLERRATLIQNVADVTEAIRPLSGHVAQGADL